MRILEKKYIHILGTFRIVYNIYKTQYVHVSTESKVQRKAAGSKYQLGNSDLCPSYKNLFYLFLHTYVFHTWNFFVKKKSFLKTLTRNK